MVLQEISGSAGACPGQEDLRAYCQGSLPRKRLEEVAGHIDGCSWCEASLCILQVDNDTLVSNLRRHVSMVPAGASARAEPAGDLEGTVFLGPPVTSGPVPRTAPGRAGTLAVKSLGPYELLEELERGGMGVVFKARQIRLNRIVALKMIRSGAYAAAEEQARFRVEAEAVARLQHPHVVQIHEFGEVDGQPYFSMEFMEGGSLAKKLAGRPLPERETAELVQTLARAVHAAHQRHIVHRDLKPSNVLLTDDGTPKVSDFGLAKLLDTQSDQTHSEAVLGTASYMAPEQARGDNKNIGPAADVYALGAILYEALTGRPPFKAATRSETLELVKSKEPKPLLAYRPNLARDLEAVCLKCLEKELTKRYASAAALADDLGRWLQGEPTLARPLSMASRTWRMVRRNSVAVAAVAVCGLAATFALAVLYSQDPEQRWKDIERRLAREEKVTLIGPTGGPLWSSCRVGSEAKTPLAADGTFTVNTWTLSLLELVRDPGRDRYLFRAEVRHLKCGQGRSQVGIYCAHRETPTTAGPFHRFIHLSYNDRIDARDEHALIARELAQPPPAPKGNTVELDYRLYREGGPDTRWDHLLAGRAAQLFRPDPNPGLTPWRTLTIVVSPERIEGRWEADEQVGALATGDLPAKTLRTLGVMRRIRPLDSSIDEVDPTFLPRGSLGLYVLDGIASFRNVMIEPHGGAD